MEECGDAIDIAHWGEGGVLELIDELPPRYRTVIHLFYYEDMLVAKDERRWRGVFCECRLRYPPQQKTQDTGSRAMIQ